MKSPWGWTSYRRTLWVANGRRVYRAKFSTAGGVKAGESWEECVIVFSTRRPVLALRHIVESGLHPNRFDNTQVN